MMFWDDIEDIKKEMLVLRNSVFRIENFMDAIMCGRRSEEYDSSINGIHDKIEAIYKAVCCQEEEPKKAKKPRKKPHA